MQTVAAIGSLPYWPDSTHYLFSNGFKMAIYKRKNLSNYYCEITINGKSVIRSAKIVKKSDALRFEAQLR